jgi:hypothetical protein
MARTQTGATYANQSQLQRRDRDLGEALDDIASQSAAIRTQGNFGLKGAPDPPHPIDQLSVVANGGFGTVTLTHNNAPAGSNYLIEYSTTSNFQNPVQVDNGISLSFQQYFKGQTLYFRAAPYFPASPVAKWTYYGTAAAPTAVSF